MAEAAFQLVGTLRALIALGEPGETIGPEQVRGASQRAPQTRLQLGELEELRTNGRLEDVTRDAMNRALAACNGNVSRAARHLGVSRCTIYRRLLSPPAESREDPR